MKGMRSITGIGMILLIVSSVFGLAISSMTMGMMRAGSSGSIILDMQKVKPQIIEACNKPAGISEITVDTGAPCGEGDTCSEEGTQLQTQTSSDIAFVQAPNYPNVLNCITCSDLLIRGILRTGLAIAMTVADMYDKKKTVSTFATDGLTKGKITGKAPQALSNIQSIATSYGDDFGKYGDDFADAARQAMKAGDSLDDAAKKATDALLDSCHGNKCAQLAQELVQSLYDDAGKYSKQLVEKTTKESLENSVRKSVEEHNKVIIDQLDDHASDLTSYLQAGGADDDFIRDQLSSLDSIRTNYLDVDTTVSTITDPTWKMLTKNKSWADSVTQWLAIPQFIICGVGGFASTFTRGATSALGPASSMATTKKANACGVGQLVGVGAGMWLHANSTITNYKYMERDINKYVQYLEIIEEQYDILDSVLSDTRAEVAIGMDQSLFVSANHTDFNQFFELGKEAMPYSSDMTAKFIEANSNLYDILYNMFGDYAYADYYFSMSADTHISNTVWSGVAAQINSSLSGTPEGNARVVMLRPQHISAIMANSRTFLERRTEGQYEDLFQRVVDKYKILYSKYNYPTLDDAIAFLESFDTADGGGASLLADLEERELEKNPGKTTTREEMLAIIDKLKTIKQDIEAISNDEKQLHLIQDRAWQRLSDTGCDSEPQPLGNLQLVKSKCAVVQNCNWDYVVDYSFYEGKTASLGDCVNLVVIVNNPMTKDPVTGDTVWRTLPAFKMNRVETEAMLGMLTLARSRGLIKATERLSGGITFGSIGSAIGSWTDMGQYCNETTDTTNTMMCCIETSGCRVGLCKICDSFRCARAINIEPRLQPGIIIDTSSSSEIKLIGNIGILS